MPAGKGLIAFFYFGMNLAQYIVKNISGGSMMVEINSDGFLCEPEKWTKEIAMELAAYEKILILTDKHWEIVFYIRNYYEDFKCIPSVHKLCAHCGIRTIDIYKLFPGGPINSACRIAGIPPGIAFT